MRRVAAATSRKREEESWKHRTQVHSKHMFCALTQGGCSLSAGKSWSNGGVRQAQRQISNRVITTAAEGLETAVRARRPLTHTRYRKNSFEGNSTELCEINNALSEEVGMGRSPGGPSKHME